MLHELSFGIQQKLGRQRLERVPEPSLVMASEEQDKEYNRAAFLSGLNVSYEFIINYLPKISPRKGEALDICCGSGQLLIPITKEMPEMHFTGVDLSDAMLQLCEKNKKENKASNVDFKKADMTKLLDIFPPKSFDLITWHNALHHCATEDDVIAVLNSISQLITDDGTVFIFDLVRVKTEALLVDFLNHTAKNLGEYFYNDTYDSYGAAFTYEELGNILKRSQLKNYRHIQPVFFGIIQMIVVSHTKNHISRRSASRLMNFKQKMDYNLLRMTLAGKI